MSPAGAGRSFVRTLAPLGGAAPGMIINSITAARSKRDHAFEVAGKIVDPVAIGAGQLRHVARWPIVDHRALVGAAVDQRVDAALGGPHDDDRRIANTTGDVIAS